MAAAGLPVPVRWPGLAACGQADSEQRPVLTVISKPASEVPLGVRGRPLARALPGTTEFRVTQSRPEAPAQDRERQPAERSPAATKSESVFRHDHDPA